MSTKCLLTLAEEPDSAADGPVRAAGGAEEQLLLWRGVWQGRHDGHHVRHHTLRPALRVQRQAHAREMGGAQSK